MTWKEFLLSDICAESKCGGRDFCECVCAKVLKEAWEKEKKKKEKKCEKEEEKKEKELKISENELTSVDCCRKGPKV